MRNSADGEFYPLPHEGPRYGGTVSVTAAGKTLSSVTIYAKGAQSVAVVGVLSNRPHG